MKIKNIYNKCMNIYRTQGLKSFVNLAIARSLTRKRLPYTLHNYPTQAQIEITNICNLQCEMCAQTSDLWKNKIPRKTLSLDEFKVIIDQFPYLRFALINGIGEPLLNPCLADMIEYAYSKGIYTGFYTNATLLTPDRTKSLFKTGGLKTIFISIDAGHPDTFDKIRKGASLTEVCDNIASFNKIKNQLGSIHPEIIACMVPMRENIREIPLLINILDKLEIRRLNIHCLSGNKDKEDDHTAKGDDTLLKEYQELAGKRGILMSYLKLPEGGINRTCTRTCLDPWITTYVNASGWLNPCCLSYHDRSMYFGNILETDFKDIWNGAIYRNFRKELKTGMPGCCSECPLHSTVRIGEI